MTQKNLELEYCSECNEPTGNGGRADGSIYVRYTDKEVGPLCNLCACTHLICVKCGEGVYANQLTDDERHEGCGGLCI